MHGDVEKAAIVSGPLNGKDSGGTLLYSATSTSNRREAANITLSTTASYVDLTATFGTGPNGVPRWHGRFLRITGTVAFDYFFSAETTTACAYQAVDATTPGQQGEHMPADCVDQVIPAGQYLQWDASAAGVLSLSLRSPYTGG